MNSRGRHPCDGPCLEHVDLFDLSSLQGILGEHVAVPDEEEASGSEAKSFFSIFSSMTFPFSIWATKRFPVPVGESGIACLVFLKHQSQGSNPIKLDGAVKGV